MVCVAAVCAGACVKVSVCLVRMIVLHLFLSFNAGGYSIGIACLRRNVNLKMKLVNNLMAKDHGQRELKKLKVDVYFFWEGRYCKCRQKRKE